MQLIIRLLRENFHLHARRYLLAFLFMAITAAMTGLSAWIMKDVINELFVERDMQKVALVSAAVVAIFLTKGFATFAQTVILNVIGNAVVATCQRRIFAHLQQQGVNFYHSHATGELVTRLTHNATAARMLLEIIVTRFGRDLLTVIGLIVVMLIQDPLLSVLAVLLGIPAFALVVRIIRKIKKIAKAEFLSLSEIVSVVQESTQGNRIVKSFRLEGHMNARMENATASVEDKANKIAKLKARTGPVMETLGGVTVGLFILYGGWRTIGGTQTPGEFVSFLTALLMAYEPAKRLAKMRGVIEQNIVGVRLMYEILDLPLTIREKPDARPLSLSQGAVALDNVTFQYGSDSPILNGLSLKAEGGKTTALVGPSGSGKTTIINLILRFYDVGSGRIEIDGQEIASVTTTSLRDSIALVSQDTFLFSGTIRDNLRLGRPDASDTDIEAAARSAFAHDFITALDHGYDTEVGENGAQLSGGQRQRLAIARAILKDAPIVLLDEATSALDSESETKVQAAFDALSENRTVIVVAHRLSTVRNADKIAVLSEGTVVEEGSHTELLARKSHYAALYNLQFDAA
ncbi:ABC transporter ATP-binding protein [Coralliovum pocilloporae]|uniref:ABC transporter ATP-binding protein n=1 Tax=Coralliovum pocilloporae TaxID=3066369 RepID=UPI003306A542